jgi:O-antigen ligase
MARSKARATRPRPPEANREGLGGLLVPLGILAALLLPYFVYSIASSDMLRESKLFGQALGVVLALAGLALTVSAAPPAAGNAAAPGPANAGVLAGRGARLPLFFFAAAALLALVSAAGNAGWVDPLVAAALAPAAALFMIGRTRAGAACAPRALGVLAMAGVASGLLGSVQRFSGLLRLPLEAPEPRFFATALVGTPGDLGAALLAPALLLWMRAVSGHVAWRGRLAAAVGLGFVLLGIGATETITPLVAFAAGVVAHLVLRPLARWRPFVLVSVLALGAGAFTGAGRRVLVKWDQVRAGKLGAASTERDIGFLAAAEMVRARPLLGVGPGAFSNAFVPARLLAEERAGRRLVHSSGSSHFENAHSEPLTLAAECGVPAAVLGMVGIAGTLALLFRAARREADAAPAASAETLLVLLASFTVLSLAAFPLRLTITAGPLAFLAGVALRGTGGGSPPSGRPGRRAALGAVAAAVLGLALVRCAATWWQGEGETALRAIGLLDPSVGPSRADLLENARTNLQRSLSLRPRNAAALLALGSTRRLEADTRAALELYRRSFDLEERAETDLNLADTALASGMPDEARPLFVRAVWLLPRLLEAVPPAVDAAGIEAEVKRLEAALPTARKTPLLPARLPGAATPLRPRFP